MKNSSEIKSVKSRFVAITASLLLLLGGGAAMWFSQDASADAQADTRSKEAETPPVFVPLESFTINLQAENGEQFLQAAFTAQLGDKNQVELFKLYMPEVRSRALLLLASKKASEISTTEGKNKLSEEILAEINQPFESLGIPQMVTAVFFTSLVIQ